MHNQYELIPGTKINCFFLSSSHLEDEIDFINRNLIHNIQINPYRGYELNTIEPLFNINKIEILFLHIKNSDLKKLSKLSNLKYLSINSNNFNINLNGLKELEHLSIFYQKNIFGMETLSNLKLLNIIKAGTSFFCLSLFEKWVELSFLQALSPRLPKSLSFLINSKKLTHLEIHYCKTAFSIKDLIYIKDTLEELIISNCKKVEGLEVLSNLKNLRKLSFVDSVPLDDISFIDHLNNLEILVVIGTSFFLNGDIKKLKGKVKYVSIDNRKHYNMKYEDFKNYDVKS